MTVEQERQVVRQASSKEEYEQLADRYDSSFQVMPYRIHIEEYSVLQAVGDVQGLEILDMACGTGHYTRLWRSQGAAHVLGVDLSSDMIAVARQTEEREPLGNIDYQVHDAGALETIGQFDLITAIYLFHYATSQEHLDRICQGIARNLRPGGQFMTYSHRPDFCSAKNYYYKYRLNLTATPDLRDGDTYQLSFVLDESWTPPITVYCWSWEAMEGALERAGLVNIERHDPIVSPDGVEQFEPGFWQAYLDCPHSVILCAAKAV